MTAISSQHPAVRQQKNCVMFFPEKLKNAPVSLFNSLEASAAAHVSGQAGCSTFRGRALLADPEMQASLLHVREFATNLDPARGTDALP